MGNANVNDLPYIPTGTRRLVAPEYLGILDFIPSFSVTPDNLAATREAVAKLSLHPLSDAQKMVSVDERFVPGSEAGRQVRVLLYRPPGGVASPAPAFLHIHGGGFVLGTPEMENTLARTYAIDFNCLVVSVDYRLAPETPFPGAVEDCYAALAWLHAQAEELGVDRQRIAIGGTSAGGGHAAALAIHARNKGEFPICFQLLDQPMLDDRTGSTWDPHPHCGEFGHTAASNRFGWKSLLGMEPGGPDVPEKAVPARVADLTGLPPTFMSVGGLDIFLEETMEYARRLLRAGVHAELHVFPGGFHGWEMAADAPQAQALRQLRRSAVLRAFQTSKSNQI